MTQFGYRFSFNKFKKTYIFFLRVHDTNYIFGVTLIITITPLQTQLYYQNCFTYDIDL